VVCFTKNRVCRFFFVLTMASIVTNIVLVFSALTVVLTPQSVESLKCYSAKVANTDPKIPVDAQEKDFSDGSMCFKKYSKAMNQPSGYYTWGASTFPENLKCGEVFESSLQSSYSRYCTCCDDGCNDAQMDGLCNDPFVGTKECYATLSESTEPALPKDAIKIKCSDTEFCGKLYVSSAPPNPNFKVYMWGCSSIPSDDCEGSLKFTPAPGAEYASCYCCGALCNDKQMDSVLEGKCVAKTTTTTTTTTTSGASATMPSATIAVIISAAVWLLG